MVDENQKLTKENKDLKKVNSDLLSRLNFLENQMREIKSEIISEVLQEVQNKQTHSENNSFSLRGEICSCLREERIRESRKLNLCIHNLPEKTGTQTEETQLSSFLTSKLALSENIETTLVSMTRFGAVHERLSPHNNCKVFKRQYSEKDPSERTQVENV